MSGLILFVCERAGVEVMEASLRIHAFVVSRHHSPIHPPATYAHISAKVKCDPCVVESN